MAVKIRVVIEHQDMPVNSSYRKWTFEGDYESESEARTKAIFKFAEQVRKEFNISTPIKVFIADVNARRKTINSGVTVTVDTIGVSTASLVRVSSAALTRLSLI